jgi:hypothetical protein
MALSDIYGQRPFVPGEQGMQQIGQAFQAAPGLAMSRLQQQEAETQRDRLNRPVTPWQKDIMGKMAGNRTGDPDWEEAVNELLNGGDPATIAAKLKAKKALVGGNMPATPVNGGTTQQPSTSTMGASAMPLQQSKIPASLSQAIFGAPEQSPQMSMPPSGPGYGVQMPMTGGQDRDAFYAQMTDMPIPGDMTGMQRPAAGGSLPPGYGAERASGGRPGGLLGVSGGSSPEPRMSDTFGGMTGRDYNDYMDGMGKVRSVRQQRDYLGEIALRNSGNVQVANVKADSAEKAAKYRIDAAKMMQDRSDVRAELDRRVREKGLSEAARHNLIAEQIAWAKIQEAKNQFRIARSENERLKAAQMLLQHSNALIGAKARVLGSDIGIMTYENDDIEQMIGEWEQEAKETVEAAQQYIDSQAGATKTTTVEGSSEKKSAGMRTYKNKAGQTKNATPAQMEEAIKKGWIKPGEWE